MQNLPETARALMESQAYPDQPGKIALMQTQMSFVFLTGDYVYKMKKPVNLGYLDYTALEQRRFFCQKEVELNQRLCPEAYLEMVSITRQGDRITPSVQSSKCLRSAAAGRREKSRIPEPEKRATSPSAAPRPIHRLTP